MLRYLRDRRHKLQAERQGLRALVDLHGLHGFVELPPFERGILGILRGGLRSVEAERYDVDVILTSDDKAYGMGAHTLVDLMMSLGDSSQANAACVNTQIDNVMRAWEDVTAGYAANLSLVVDVK